MEKIAIGVDIGTTQTKAVAFREDGVVQASAYIRYPLIQEVEGMAEQDVDQIFQAVVTCIEQVVTKVRPLDISVISFSTAMHGLIVMDKNNQPVTRVITWADNRAEKYAEELRDTALGKTIYQNTGLPMHPMTPFHKIRWLKEEFPDIYEQADKFIGMKEYIFYQLFDRYIIDISTASGTGFLNIYDLTWDQLALEEMGISVEQLPFLVPPTYQVSDLKDKWVEHLGLPAETIFVLGGADGPLSNLGLGAVTKGTATLTVGTSGALRYIVDQPQVHPQAETFCCVLDETHWVIGGATSNGAGIFDWACENLLTEVQSEARSAEKNPYNAVMNLVKETPVGAKGLLFQPYLLGERAPLWNAEATGSFVGLKRNHDSKLMMRAVVEGICLNLKRILTELEDLGGAVKEIRATGGFADSEVFKKVMADVLGQRLSLTESVEASALGAVLLGWQSIGKIADLNTASEQVEIYKTIEPDFKNNQIYQQVYPLFITTQQQLSASYHQLAKLRADLE
ncbi:gluconate kinase [Enterococcus haemoperoxidus ATCC BAA-382]|uniref:Gluconate kinase n=1 Tax=Enterococcus haemoperoxidus ATCC BAA-382 TaxID=1158608 RepID=R2T426_9ENTE|nr:gluconokinase [Enterococcus haemoperoxidus]EOH94949.1 gluconate kinase [Enterococcus haemoperoxidus ATCC BAA-382]EOT60348.1 gluconate kinase [Enterococcus haemoperoxidus ATCC BAA-382]OJG54778.1 gluconate kinase [Enterococcus haemoperoxidus]